MIELKNATDVIRAERIKRKIKQKDLAEELCITPPAFCLYENGKRSLAVDVFIRLCLKLDLKLEDFVKGE